LASVKRNPLTLSVILVLVGLILLASLITANVSYALRFPGGNDFLVHWLGFRNLITEGVSPYSEATAQDIQNFLLSGPANPNLQPTRNVYPLYSIVFYLPFSLITDFAVARGLWMTLLEISLVLLAFLSLRLSGWKPNTVVLIFYYLFAVLFFYAVVPVVNGNAAILVAVFLTGGLLAIKNRADELAGVLLAFSMIKPQISVILALYVMIWSIRQRRQKILIWFFFTLLILTVSCMLIIPDWVQQNLLEILRYIQAGQVTNLQWALGEMLPGFGGRVGWAVSVVLVLLLMVEWGLAGRFRFIGFLFGALITLLATQWIGLPADAGNFIVLFPILPVIFEAWSRRWQKAGGLYILISLLFLLVITYLMYFQAAGKGFAAQFTPVMFLPVPIFLFGALYWSRWWILQPDNGLALDAFKEEDAAFFE
jgi:hypothetical protein